MVGEPAIPTRLQGPGVLIRTLRKGSGPLPKRGNTCLVHYKTIVKGEVVDNTYDREMPLKVVVGSPTVNVGWKVVLPKLSKGTVAEVTIPSLYAYGATGCPPWIPPDTTVVYEMEMIDIMK